MDPDDNVLEMKVDVVEVQDLAGGLAGKESARHDGRDIAGACHEAAADSGGSGGEGCEAPAGGGSGGASARPAERARTTPGGRRCNRSWADSEAGEEDEPAQLGCHSQPVRVPGSSDTFVGVDRVLPRLSWEEVMQHMRGLRAVLHYGLSSEFTEILMDRIAELRDELGLSQPPAGDEPPGASADADASATYRDPAGPGGRQNRYRHRAGRGRR